MNYSSYLQQEVILLKRRRNWWVCLGGSTSETNVQQSILKCDVWGRSHSLLSVGDKKNLAGGWRLGRRLMLKNSYVDNYSGSYYGYNNYLYENLWLCGLSGGRVDWLGEFNLPFETMGVDQTSQELLVSCLEQFKQLGWGVSRLGEELPTTTDQLYSIWRMWGEQKFRWWAPGQRLLDRSEGEGCLYERCFHWEFYGVDPWRS